MSLKSTGNIVGLMAAIALLLAACSGGTAPDQAADIESASVPAASIASPEEDPTPSAVRAGAGMFALYCVGMWLLIEVVGVS